MVKSVIINSLKLILAVGLIWWLVNSGKLDFSLLTKALENPLNLLFVIFLMMTTMSIAALRWKFILQYKHKTSLKLRHTFKANWVGLFFNCVLPGAVSGDLIKVFYVEHLNSSWSKKYLFATAFLDRLLGLFGLICVGAISCLLNYSYLTSLSPAIKNLVHFNFLLLFVIIVSFVMVFWFQTIPLKLSSSLKKFSLLSGILKKLEVMWEDLCSFKHNLLIYLGMSMIVQGLAVCVFWYVVSPFTDGAFELKHAFAVFPIGMITMAIPISPAGLGVGHYVFENLFQYIGFSGGASLFNIYFVILVVTSLTGVIPYLLHSGKKLNLKEIKEAN